MKKRIYLFLIVQLPLLLWSQLILIDKTDSSNYIVNERTVFSGGKKAVLINYMTKYDNNAELVRPLVIFKIFEQSKTELLENPGSAQKIADYIRITVIPKLNADMYLRIENRAAINIQETPRIFDSLILYDGKTYQLITGVIVSEFFNISSFKQLNPLQTNGTLFNTHATIASIRSWSRDSIPILGIKEGSIDGKIFLLRKKGNDFTFFKIPFLCRDCFFDFYNEYIYRKEYGIVAFKSKHIYRTSESGGRLWDIG